MKLVKHANGKEKLQISKKEWLSLGKQMGWRKEATDNFKNEIWVKFREATKNNSAMKDAVVNFLIGLRNIPGMTNAMLGDIIMKAEEFQNDKGGQLNGAGETPNMAPTNLGQ
jgi:hypothetical protein